MSYTKTTWVTGDIVTAPKLNNLESGVEANDTNKLNKPSDNGTAGQLLISNGDGTTSWESTDTTLAVSGVPADAKTVGDSLNNFKNAISEYVSVDVSGLEGQEYYINGDKLTSITPARLISIPATGVKQFKITCSVSSTKRIGFADSVANNATIYDGAEYTGTLDTIAVNSGNHAYLVIQLFINSDSEQTVSTYLAGMTIGELSAIDIVARNTFEDYAKIDGYYEDMTVGNAEELVTGLTEEENVPFIFRTAGGSLEIGSREEMTVVGGSLVWNQLASLSASDWDFTRMSMTAASETITATVTSSSSLKFMYIPVTPLHKYLLTGKLSSYSAEANLFYGVWKGTSDNSYQWRASVPTATDSSTPGVKEVATIFTVDTGTKQTYFRFQLGTNAILNEYFTVEKPQLIDLTALFGTTIADYIYSLEQSSTGAGIAWFKKLFPKNYYPFANPSFVHVNASEFKTVGFNQCNDTIHANHFWEDGVLKTNKNAHYAAVDTKIRVIPGMSYCFYAPDRTDNSGKIYLSTFDVNNTFIETVNESIGNDNYHVFALDDNVYYVAVGYYSSGTLTVGERICVSIHWDSTRDGEYEPYTEHSYPLDSSVVLKGYPMLVDGELKYDGDEYLPDGTIIRNFEEVTLSNLSWSTIYTGTTNVALKADLPVAYERLRASGRRKFLPYPLSMSGEVIGQATLNDPDSLDVGLYTYYQTTAGDTTSLYAIMPIGSNPTGKLVYMVRTPTTETATPYTTPQIVDNWGTEQFTVTAQNGVEVPVGHSTIYPISLRDKLEAAPDLPDDDGDFVLRMSGNSASYARLASEFPATPTEPGTYTLKATVVDGGTTTLSWVLDT